MNILAALRDIFLRGERHAEVIDGLLSRSSARQIAAALNKDAAYTFSRGEWRYHFYSPGYGPRSNLVNERGRVTRVILHRAFLSGPWGEIPPPVIPPTEMEESP